MIPVRAKIWHLATVAGILWSFTRSTPWMPNSRSRVSDLALITRILRRGWVRLVHDGLGPAGFIARDGERIHALYVHQRAHGRGIGRALLDDAKARCARLELWVAEQNVEAREFYASQGFVMVERTSGHGNDEGIPDMLLVWPAKRSLNT